MKYVYLFFPTLFYITNLATAQTQTLGNQTHERIYYLNESNASFPGGTKALYEYLDGCPYPDSALVNHIKGVVVASLVVEKDGSILMYKILRTPHPILSKAMTDCISSMPRWIPGMIGDTTVRTVLNLPYKWDPSRLYGRD